MVRKVLMFGWEFPPFNSGGLGTACHGLTKSLSNLSVDITFVVPCACDFSKSAHLKLISASNLSHLKIKTVNSPLSAYMSSEEYYNEILSFGNNQVKKKLYGKDLIAEVHRYSRIARMIASACEHEIIHAHDWMTFLAGIEAKKVSGKPLIVHVHATEFDRTGNNGVNQQVYDIERYGMHFADKIIAVSNFTKRKIVEHYGVPASKVEVVHNAVELKSGNFNHLKNMKNTVLFLGRITLQKGPDWFIQTARKVVNHFDDVKFIIAGNGDMLPQIIQQASDLADKVLFTGFLSGEEVDRAYQMADVYVMPSVSEPFGITPLEAMRNDVPVIISKQSGVSEVVNHCLKTDFWDVESMANMIISVLKYKELHESLRENGQKEIKKFNWDEPASKCLSIYNNLADAS